MNLLAALLNASTPKAPFIQSISRDIAVTPLLEMSRCVYRLPRRTLRPLTPSGAL